MGFAPPWIGAQPAAARGFAGGSVTPVNPVIPAPFSFVNGFADGPTGNGWYEEWSATYVAPHVVTALEPFTVRRPGYDANGLPTTYDDTVNVTRMVRIPLATPATVPAPPTTDQATIAALSDAVLQPDIIFGGALNNSSIQYPSPIAGWVDVPKQLIDAVGIDLEVYATHMFARNGRGVACVKITGTPTTGIAVTKTAAYSISTKYGDRIPVYKAPFSTADFPINGNAAVTFTYEVFPWCGVATAINSGVYPNVLVANTAIIHQTVGPATIFYAYVDGVGGAPALGTSLAAAKLTPYAEVTAAMTAIFSIPGNDASFCHIVFKAGVAHIWNNTAPTGATRLARNGWLYIEGDPTDPDPKTNVIITTVGTNKGIFSAPGAGLLNYICIRKCTFTVPAASNIANFNFAAALWRDDINFVSAITTPMTAGTYCFVTRSSGSGAGGQFGLSGNNMRHQLVRASISNQNIAANIIVSTIGSGATGTLQLGNATNLATQNLIMLCVQRLDATSSSDIINMTPTTAGPPPQAQNIAIVNFICSNSGVMPGPFCTFSGASATNFMNITLFNITGGPSGGSVNPDACRMNFLNYPNAPLFPTPAGQTFGLTPTQGSWRHVTMKNCNFSRISYKDDSFSGTNDGNGGCVNVIGDWSNLNGCGVRNIQSEDTNPTFRADLSIAGNENGFMGINSVAGVNIVYVDQANNNWTPVSGYRMVPAEDIVESWDVFGTSFRTDGTQAAGAVAI